jgi:hypothetical protein
VDRAFDEARFGSSRTLNLRSSLPTADEAVRRADAWLRSQQAAGASEALVITGRGNNSEGGISPVREGVVQLLLQLRRKGVVSGHQEHTPGSFVVHVAPLRALLEAPRRRRDRQARPTPAAIEGLDAATNELLRELASRVLHDLGAPSSEPFLGDEMRRQYTILVRAVAEGGDSEGRLRRAIELVLRDYD